MLTVWAVNSQEGQYVAELSPQGLKRDWFLGVSLFGILFAEFHPAILHAVHWKTCSEERSLIRHRIVFKRFICLYGTAQQDASGHPETRVILRSDTRRSVPATILFRTNGHLRAREGVMCEI